MTALAHVRSPHWPIAGLLLLGALPLSFGVLRMLQFAGVVAVMPAIASAPWHAAPIVIHILSAAIYAILAAFQFSATMRQRRPSWHRIGGRVSLAGGMLVGLSALWLTVNGATLTPGGVLLALFRVIFSVGLLTSLILAFLAVKRRDIRRHREWMTRAYALALGAATQMIVLMIAEMLTGASPVEIRRALLMGAAWTFNLAVAEWLVRRRRN